jgi:hypothetical protein
MSLDVTTPLQKALLEKSRYDQLFAVVSWGCAATRWLAKALNSHPEILCLHNGNGAAASFHSSMDSLQYFRVLSLIGWGYTAVGDVHGLPRMEISKVKEAFGHRFNAVIVVREPVARLRSQMALHGEFQGLDGWDLSHVQTLIESKNIVANSEESRMFVHAVNMLNAVTEEISQGTIYKAEDLTTNPNTLAALIAEISGGQIGTNREWLDTCLELRKVNAHVKPEASALTDWQADVVRAVVRPESWKIYEELGYVTPPFEG